MSIVVMGFVVSVYNAATRTGTAKWVDTWGEARVEIARLLGERGLPPVAHPRKEVPLQLLDDETLLVVAQEP